MDTCGEKDLCLFWEWAQEYFAGDLGKTDLFTNMGA